MIDFVSTRPETDEHTRRAAQLLAAFITHHIVMACSAPTSQEKAERRNLTSEGRRGIRYLFDPESKFETHADLVGSDAESLRRALLSTDVDLGMNRSFTHSMRRHLQWRYEWYRAETDLITEATTK